MPSLDARDPDMALAVQGPLPRSALSRVPRGKAEGGGVGRLARVGALVSVLALTVAGCGGGSQAHVRAATVGRATVVEVVAAPAIVAARSTATVTAPAAGTVGPLRAREGQRVRAGQVLLRIGSPDAHRRLRLARQADARAAAGAGSVSLPVRIASAGQAGAAARQSLASARRSALRLPAGPARVQALSVLRVLQSQYAATRTVTDQAARQLAEGVRSLSDAIAGLSSAQRVQTRAAVEVASRTVAALTVRAPVAGTVSLAPPAAGGSPSDTSALVDKLPQNLQGQAADLVGGGGSSSVDTALEPGHPVSSGQPILTVTDTSRLTLTAHVDETDVLLVKEGIPASATLDAVPDATYAATVTTIDPEPTTSSRGGVSYVVRLSLGRGTLPDGSAAPTARPGMRGVVQLQVLTARHTVAVPAMATFRDGPRDAVWVVKNDVTRQRTVRLGAQGETLVQVLEGLKPGERIVVGGADEVRDGERVS